MIQNGMYWYDPNRFVNNEPCRRLSKRQADPRSSHEDLTDKEEDTSAELDEDGKIDTFGF